MVIYLCISMNQNRPDFSFIAEGSSTFVFWRVNAIAIKIQMFGNFQLSANCNKQINMDTVTIPERLLEIGFVRSLCKGSRST